jgi:alpha-L-fucosidase 2
MMAALTAARSFGKSKVGAASSEWLLWYKQPAKIWTDALPVGNGRLGAMVFGGINEEHLQLNEDTLWSGSPREWNNPQASEALPGIRKLVLEEKRYKDADRACRRRSRYGRNSPDNRKLRCRHRSPRFW